MTVRAATPTVLLITDTYPAAGGERVFLEPEIRALGRHLRIVVVPTTLIDEPEADLPSGVELDLTLAIHMRSVVATLLSLVRAVFWVQTFREIAAFGPRGLDPRIIAAVIVRGARWQRAHRWASQRLRRARPTGVYTWWATPPSFGVAQAAGEWAIPTLTRIHGYDLYPEQDRLGHIPFQGRGLTLFTRIHPVSEHGHHYLLQRYPNLASALHPSYLGVDPAPGPGVSSADGTFRVLSCSSCDANKRVDLIAECMVLLAAQHPEVDFTWTHIGDGPMMGDLQRIIALEPGLAARCHLFGSLPNDQVRDLMANSPVDLFVNLSRSEGLAVTLMEASSSGIPLLATDVGGSSEIVLPAGGQLVAAEPAQVVAAILAVRQLDPADTAAQRRAGYDTWAQRFNAERNYAQFAEGLDTLLAETTDRARSHH